MKGLFLIVLLTVVAVAIATPSRLSDSEDKPERAISFLTRILQYFQKRQVPNTETVIANLPNVDVDGAVLGNGKSSSTSCNGVICIRKECMGGVCTKTKCDLNSMNCVPFTEEELAALAP